MMPQLNARQLADAPVRAGLRLMTGKVSEARALCEQALAEAPVAWPGRVKALQMLARVARRQHDWSRALEALNEVLVAISNAAALAFGENTQATRMRIVRAIDSGLLEWLPDPSVANPQHSRRVLRSQVERLRDQRQLPI